jgi:long-chain fatty acid transport protein
VTSVRLLLSLFFCALVPARALASGFASPVVGPSRYGVTTFGPLSVHHNPAGIAYAKKLRIVAGGDLLLGDLRYQRERRAAYQYQDSLDFALPIDPLQIDRSKTGEDSTVQANPVGAMPSIYAEFPLGTLPLSGGVGVYVPYAAQVKWPKEGAQRFQLVEATLADVYITAALAMAFERVSVGIAGSLVVGYANLSKVQDLAAVPLMGDALARPPINQNNDFGTDADPGLRELDTLARPFVLKNAFGLGATVKPGIMVEAAEGLFLGASYELFAKLNMVGDFTLDMNDPFFTQDLASQGLSYDPVVKGRGQLRYVLPDVLRAGVRYGFGKKYGDEPRTQLALEGTFTRWSSVDNFKVEVKSKGLRQTRPDCEPQSAAQCELIPNQMKFYLPRKWKNTYGGTLRASHMISENLLVWGLAGYETAAVPDATIDTASPDGVRITLGGGLTQLLTEHLDLSVDVVVQQVLERKVVASDYDLGNGTYSMRLYSLGAFLGYHL